MVDLEKQMSSKKEKSAAWWQEYYAKNRDKELARHAAFYHADPARGKYRKLKSDSKKYGWAAPSISLEAFRLWYDAALFVCNGFCPCCGLPFGVKEPHVDHDHTTGEIRTLLCRKCNWLEGIGIFHLKKAAEFFVKPFCLEN